MRRPKNITYVNSEEIVDEVKLRMMKYFASNKVDDSIFPRVLRYCVGKMGLKICPEKKAVLPVIDSKVVLPKDFKRLTMALSCFQTTEYMSDPRQFHTHDKEIEIWDETDNSCDVFEDDCGNMFKIVQTVNFSKFSYETFKVLKPSVGAVPYCDNACFNLGSKCPDEFEIKKEHGQHIMHTNFPSGTLYLEYLGDLTQEVGFMIPDNETIRAWVFNALRTEVYSYLYDNGEEVQNKLAEAKSELHIAHERAKEVYSRSEVSEFYNVANKLAARYADMDRWIQGYYYSRGVASKHPLYRN